MDKELSFGVVLALAIAPSLFALYFSVKRPIILFFVLPIAALLNFAQLSEIIDPFVGPAIPEEAGLIYVLLSWLSPILTIAAVAFGLLLRRRGRLA